MADPDSLPKPAEYFIDIVDFLGILIPGVIIGVIAILVFRESAHLKNIVGLLNTDWARLAVFLVMSYFAGLLFFVLGSFLDPLYDKAYKASVQDKQWPIRARAAWLLKKTVLESEYRDDDNKYVTARTYLTLHAPAGVTILNRLDANTKLFRSLCAMWLTLTPVVANIADIAGSPILLLCCWPIPAFFFARLRWTPVAQAFELKRAQIHAQTDEDRERQEADALRQAWQDAFSSKALWWLRVSLFACLVVSIWSTWHSPFSGQNLWRGFAFWVGYAGFAAVLFRQYAESRLTETMRTYQLLVMVLKTGTGAARPAAP